MQGRSTLLLAIVSSLLTASALAGPGNRAQPPSVEGPYLCFGWGRAKAGLFGSRDSGTKVSAGYRVSRFFGVEAGYVDLGSYSNGVDVDVSGWDALAAGFLPLGERVEMLAKVGVISSSTEVRGLSGSDRTGVYGAGVSFRFSRAVGVRVERELYAVGRVGDIVLLSVVGDIRF